MSFLLVPKSVTLNDLEWGNVVPESVAKLLAADLAS